jgi:photosynthetic reaction center cytochrome c subunit
MARELNNDYLTPLTKVFPANRLSASGDGPKLNCATCHQGAYKPLNGVSMLAMHPELASGKPVVVSEGTGDANGAVLFFAVGSVQLSEGAAKNLSALIQTLKAKQAAKVAISGYSSAAGDLPANQELAKNRALAVRDALVAAGISVVRVTLEKPMSAEANLSGEDPKARRVEVALI